jgi:hypothetical protein
VVERLVLQALCRSVVCRAGHLQRLFLGVRRESQGDVIPCMFSGMQPHSAVAQWQQQLVRSVSPRLAVGVPSWWGGVPGDGNPSLLV